MSQPLGIPMWMAMLRAPGMSPEPMEPSEPMREPADRFDALLDQVFTPPAAEPRSANQDPLPMLAMGAAASPPPFHPTDATPRVGVASVSAVPFHARPTAPPVSDPVGPAPQEPVQSTMARPPLAPVASLNVVAPTLGMPANPTEAPSPDGAQAWPAPTAAPALPPLASIAPSLFAQAAAAPSSRPSGAPFPSSRPAEAPITSSQTTAASPMAPAEGSWLPASPAPPSAASTRAASPLGTPAGPPNVNLAQATPQGFTVGAFPPMPHDASVGVDVPARVPEAPQGEVGGAPPSPSHDGWLADATPRQPRSGPPQVSANLHHRGPVEVPGESESLRAPASSHRLTASVSDDQEEPTGFRVVSRLGPEGHYGLHRGAHHTSPDSIPPSSMPGAVPDPEPRPVVDLDQLHREATFEGEVTVQVDDDVSVDVRVDGDEVHVVVESTDVAAADLGDLQSELAFELAQSGQDLESYAERSKDDPTADAKATGTHTGATSEGGDTSVPVARGRLVNRIA